MDINNSEMTIENLKQKIENQANLIKELTKENEELYQKLMVRPVLLKQMVYSNTPFPDDLHLNI